MRFFLKENPAELLDWYLLSRAHAAYLFGLCYFYVVTLRLVEVTAVTKRRSVICTLYQIFLGRLNGGGSDGLAMLHA
jgi:hypothetical protein